MGGNIARAWAFSYGFLFVLLGILVGGCVQIEDVTNRQQTRYQQLFGLTVKLKRSVFLIEDRERHVFHAYPSGRTQDSAESLADFKGQPLRCGLGNETFIVGVLAEGTLLQIKRIVEVTHSENGRYNQVFADIVSGERQGVCVRIDSLLKDVGASHVFHARQLIADDLYLVVCGAAGK